MSARFPTCRLTVPSDPAFLSMAGIFVREAAKTAGFEESEQEELERATREAVENVITHAFEPGEEATIDLVCEQIPAGLRVRIKEKGLPFDPARISQTVTERRSGDSDGSAAGIALMRRLVDEVSFHNLGWQGKETRLVKYHSRGSVSDLFDPRDLEPYPQPARVRPLPTRKDEVTVRLMEPNEAVEVARCIYKAYGYSYFTEVIYYPDHMVELNREGRLISAVAVTSDGAVVGHAAISHPDENMQSAEIVQAAVKPDFRGQGILTRITRFLIEEGRSRGFAGLYVEAVTTHTFSQRVATKLGFRHCGLLLGYAPADLAFKGATERVARRESYELKYQYLKKPARLTLYPPPTHEQFVVRLFENVGISPEVAVPESFRPGFAESEIELESGTTVELPVGYATIQILRYGEKVISEVRAQVRELCANRIETIILYLDLRDPLTYHFTPEFEKMGFMVTGILPGAACGEALMLQYLNNVPLVLDDIKLHSETARQTLDYIRRRYPEMV